VVNPVTPRGCAGVEAQPKPQWRRWRPVRGIRLAQLGAPVFDNLGFPPPRSALRNDRGRRYAGRQAAVVGPASCQPVCHIQPLPAFRVMLRNAISSSERALRRAPTSTGRRPSDSVNRATTALAGPSWPAMSASSGRPFSLGAAYRLAKSVFSALTTGAPPGGR
jgi:hypothetical protein